MYRVEFQQVGVAAGIAPDLVDMHDLVIRVIPAGAETQFAHAAEAIDGDADGHWSSLTRVEMEYCRDSGT